jgi:small GTP-binding protein
MHSAEEIHVSKKSCKKTVTKSSDSRSDSEAKMEKDVEKHKSPGLSLSLKRNSASGKPAKLNTSESLLPSKFVKENPSRSSTNGDSIQQHQQQPEQLHSKRKSKSKIDRNSKKLENSAPSINSNCVKPQNSYDKPNITPKINTFTGISPTLHSTQSCQIRRLSKTSLDFPPRDKFTLTIKLLLLGDSGVGKTSCMCRYLSGAFPSGLLGTAGIDVRDHFVHIQADSSHSSSLLLASANTSQVSAISNSKSLISPSAQPVPQKSKSKDNKISSAQTNDYAKVQIWDTAGQERYKTLTNSFYKGAAGILLFYDVTDHSSFTNVEVWLQNISKSSAHEDIEVMLIGNKTDLEGERVISYESGIGLAAKYGFQFMEASAKEGNGVQEAFDGVIRGVIANPNLQAFIRRKMDVVRLGKGENVSCLNYGKKGCC